MTTAEFYDMIIGPIITEKTTIQKDEKGQVTFSVAPKANRIEIKRSIEKIFNVKVASVRTLNIKGKIKRRGRILGKRKDYKKAVVTLMPGERIDFFEGV